MPADLLATTTTLWMLVAVAGAGVAVLPWSDRELRDAARALAAAPALLRRRASRRGFVRTALA